MASTATMAERTQVVQPLSQTLRDETARAHAGAEGSEFMTALVRGDLDAEAVHALTGQLWFIYDALETAVRRVAHTALGSAVADPRLERRPALESDLANMMGSDWREKVRILPATARYVARLESLGEDEAARVIAHHYVRYLGDISGGQVIAARLGTIYDIDADALRFYDFAAIGKIPPYRAAYRRQLDELPLSAGEREALIAEAQEAFAFNTAVFADLSRARAARQPQPVR